MKPEKMIEIEKETKGMILAIIFMSVFVLMIFGLAPYL